jgi:uncharacterized protein (TIGR00299 family) protein
MSRILYFDCFSGISGDMVLGALLDAGLPFGDLKTALGSLAISGFDISATRVLRAGVSATKFSVHERGGPGNEDRVRHERPNLDHSPDRHLGAHRQSHESQEHRHPHRSLPEICALIDTSSLSEKGRDRAKMLFRRLADAEAVIHHMPVEQVHLHEVGALDSIIDIVGTVFALEWARVDQIVCSPLNVGSGMVESAHGLFPAPAPATLALLGDAPIYGGTVQKEMVTPTGALIVSSYAATFGPIPPMSVEQIGYGAGARDNPVTPNVLRVLVGRATDRPRGDRVAVLECEIDDMNPQIFGVLMDRLYAAGALEVFYVPVQMKKNRPGTLLTVIAPLDRRTTLTDLVFRETTTIGLRHTEVDRDCLKREVVDIDTPLGPVRFKLAWRNDTLVNAAPEFEDCATLATAHNRSIKDVQAIAVQAYGAARDISPPRP